MSFSTLLFFLTVVRLSIAGYVLEDDYTPANFFSMFDFFTTSDPTHGFVNYVSQSTAQSNQMISTTSNSVYIGVDHTNVQSQGRSSVRITSTKTYNQGLVILDLAHMPGGTCGEWPAFWAVGSNWPTNGEIDIIEGVNDATSNAMTLHTGPNCAIKNTGSFSGSISTSNCYVQAADQSANAGCSIGASGKNSYGKGFNSAGGGVYATLWTDSYISIYFFSHGSVPSDITSGSPNPNGWGVPQANFSGACDMTTSFKDLSLVFDNTFCGDWAGAVWSTGSCASKASTCEDYVANNPSAFSDSYWEINSLKVYKEGGSYPVAPSVSSYQSSTPASSVAIPSSSSIAISVPSISVPSISIPSISVPGVSSYAGHDHSGKPSYSSPSQQTGYSAIAAEASAATPTTSELLKDTLSPTTNLAAATTPPPFPGGNHTRSHFPTGTAPFPAGNHTRPPFPSGTIGAPFPIRNGSHHHHGQRPSGVTGFLTRTVTAVEYMTVEKTEYIGTQYVTATPSAPSSDATPTALKLAELPRHAKPNSEKRHHVRHLLGRQKRHGRFH